MDRVLSDETRRAVDLFLDQGAEAVDGGITKVLPAVSQEQVAAVDNLFALIGLLPADDPPAKLVAKTMRRIDRAAGRQTAQAPRRPAATTPPAI